MLKLKSMVSMVKLVRKALGNSMTELAASLSADMRSSFDVC